MKLAILTARLAVAGLFATGLSAPLLSNTETKLLYIAL